MLSFDPFHSLLAVKPNFPLWLKIGNNLWHVSGQYLKSWTLSIFLGGMTDSLFLPGKENLCVYLTEKVMIYSSYFTLVWAWGENSLGVVHSWFNNFYNLSVSFWSSSANSKVWVKKKTSYWLHYVLLAGKWTPFIKKWTYETCIGLPSNLVFKLKLHKMGILLEIRHLVTWKGKVRKENE